MEQLAAAPSGSLSRYWGTKEGKFGVVFFGILATVATVFLAPIVLPWILWFTQSLLTALLMLVALGLLIRIITSPNTWMLYKMLARWIGGWIIALDPISILHEVMGKMQKRFEIFKQYRGKIKGVQKEVDNTIADYKAAADKAKRMAQKATELRDPAEAALNVAEYERRQGRIRKYEAFKSQLALTDLLLDKAQKATDLVIRDTQNQISDLETDTRITKITFRALSNAWSILSGNPSEQATMQRAWEIAQQQLNERKGMIDQMATDLEPIFKANDLESAMMQDRAAELIKEWDEKIPKLLTQSTVSLNLQSAPQKQYAVVGGNGDSNEYSNLLKNRE